MTIETFDLLAWVEHDLGAPLRRDGRGWWWCCPFHQDKSPSFLVSQKPNERGRYHCFGCSADGDAIEYVRRRRNLGYAAALDVLGLGGGKPNNTPAPDREPEPETLAPPCHEWRTAATRFVLDSQIALWDEPGAAALAWLRDRRGLTDDTIRWAALGYNPSDRFDGRPAWGQAPAVDQAGRPKQIWLPRGVVIPWWIDNQLWNVRIRRLDDDLERDRQAGRQPRRYIGPAGFGNGLYNAARLSPDRAAVLLEGEIDALTVYQAAGDLATATATGGTSGARRLKWVGRLALAPCVLVAFDDDENGAGDTAAQYWLDVLRQNGRRWRAPWGKDANGLATAGGDVRAWIAAGVS